MPDPAIALPTRRRTRKLAERLSALLLPGDLVILKGDLGAGKTFFARALARALGVPPSISITSPTFTLVHEIESKIPIAHADLYRLNDPGELAELGLRERRGEGAALLVEWGEPYIAALGGDALVLDLLVLPGGNGREARVSGTGPRGLALAAALADRSVVEPRP
ncbi:MAG: tRNA (adenosine(37)-N6)-threonylcarbamoyltransferase complex ATPase subunit type 1 TsaE [Byssovorax sp.]